MNWRLKAGRWAKKSGRMTRAILLALVTPLLEKNPSKQMTFSRCYAPMVLSMSRVIVLLFAAAMLRQVDRAGVAGWPEATLCIAIVLAIPLLSALERVRPEQTIALMRSLFRRMGEGAVRTIGGLYVHPSKYDDHRDDGGSAEEADRPGTSGSLRRAA